MLVDAETNEAGYPRGPISRDVRGEDARPLPRGSQPGVRWNEALTFATKVWTCHQRVFGDGFADYDTWYSDLFEKHAKREGHRLALVQDDDIVTGYAWGYVGQRGQYWADLLCDSLPERITSHWVGGNFDVVELAVLPEHRRRGLGQALHDCLLDGVAGRCLLSTSSDPDDPAVRMYARSGWKTLGPLRPGVQVMGLDRG